MLHPSLATDSATADQQLILERLRIRLAAPESTDALERLDRIIADDEARRLEAFQDEARQVVARNRDFDADGRRHLNARDFGARGDGRHDDGPALQAALAATAAAGRGAVLAIPRGNYRIEGFADPQRRYALTWKGAVDAVVDAEPGTVLVSTQIGGVLLLDGCENVELRHLALDHDPSPSTQGTIISACLVPGDLHAGAAGDMTGTDGPAGNELELLWQPDPGHAAPDQGAFAQVGQPGINAFDPSTHEPLGGHGALRLLALKPAADGRFLLRCAPGRGLATEVGAGRVPAAVAAGGRLGLRTRGVDGARCALWVDDCRWCGFEGLEIRASYHFGVLVSHTTGCRFRACRMGRAITDGPVPRLCALNADGFHCKSNFHGPRIESCEVLNTPDDCGNLYARCASAGQQLDARTLVLDAVWDDADRYHGDFADGQPAADRWGWRPDRRAYRVGDLLLLIDPCSGSPDLLARITALRPHPWHGRQAIAVELDAPLPESLRTRHALGQDGPLPSDSFFLRHDGTDIEHFVVNLAGKSDGFVIRGNHMGRNTVTAFKLKASNGLIVDNHFERHGWCCVSLVMELMWQEGFAPRNILLTGNCFDNRFGINSDCGYPVKTPDLGPPYLGGIDVVDNIFVHGDDGWSVRLGQLRDGSVTGNQLPGCSPVHIRASLSGLRLAGNHYAMQPPPAPEIEDGASGLVIDGPG